MAMNLFGHGFALSYDVVIQGAPAISAAAAGISAADILSQAWPVFWVMGGVTVLSAFLLNRKSMGTAKLSSSGNVVNKQDSGSQGNSRAALALAAAVPLAFLADIVCMLALDLNGGDATSVVSGTAVLLMCFGAVLGFGKQSPEKVTRYLTDGFLFAIRIFAPVIVIGAFFFLGGGGITSILGEGFGDGILNDWAVWLAAILL